MKRIEGIIIYFSGPSSPTIMVEGGG